jgi:hypothetical protein
LLGEEKRQKRPHGNHYVRLTSMADKIILAIRGSQEEVLTKIIPEMQA